MKDNHQEKTSIKIGPATHLAVITVVEMGNFVRKTDPREVRVMAVAEGYAMVRRKGCMPYVASTKEIEQ